MAMVVAHRTCFDRPDGFVRWSCMPGTAFVGRRTAHHVVQSRSGAQRRKTWREPMDDRDDVPRQVLPIPDQKPSGLTTYDAKDPDTKFAPIAQLRPPAGAPNVV